MSGIAFEDFYLWVTALPIVLVPAKNSPMVSRKAVQLTPRLRIPYRFMGWYRRVAIR